MSIQFHILSFEGPDPYAQAGGIGSRVSGLTRGLADMGFDTHLWFVGDPALPGHEDQGDLHLHRWCQWISHHHPHGVYDGERCKADDYGRSLPPALIGRIDEAVAGGGQVVVLAEEWQTIGAVLHLDYLLRQRGIRDRVSVLWNANNTFGFDGVDWRALSAAAVITTVSRYMKHLMRPLGVQALVVPNGLSPEAFVEVPDEAAVRLRAAVQGRTVLTKVARWDPDKRWLAAVSITAMLKREGFRPLLIARGGLEAHGYEVLGAARSAGLDVVDAPLQASGAAGVIEALAESGDADVINVRSHLDWEARRLLYRESDAVLANSGHEPFGLVGLETMAVGGVACTGASGEDYAVPGHNALVLETDEPREFYAMFRQLRERPEDETSMRSAGQETARHFAWPGVIRRALLPRAQAATQG